LISCRDEQTSESELFIKLIKEGFKIEMSKDEVFLFINSRGCFDCEKQGFYYLINNKNTLDKFNRIFISKRFLLNIDYNKELCKSFIIDSSNILEKTTLPISGITFVEFKNKTIYKIRSINPQYIRSNSFGKFFNP
jgi:hypothetical protein